MKHRPASHRAFFVNEKSHSILTPSDDSTSAAPDFEDAARFPCLATGMPQPATTMAAAVDTLYVPDRSPPVPTTSIAAAGDSIRDIFSRMVMTPPVNSSTVSPRRRSAMRSAPICDGVASPDIMTSNAR